MLDSGLPPGYDANDQDVDLPAYSSLSGVGREVPSNLTDLSDGASKEFKYNIPLKGNKSSASLVLYGNALISKHLPTFLEDSKVDGLVKVDVESGESINAVVISVRVVQCYLYTSTRVYIVTSRRFKEKSFRARSNISSLTTTKHYGHCLTGIPVRTANFKEYMIGLSLCISRKKLA